MSTDRRAILSLIAMGRITPREAERLLAVWPDGDETIVRLVVFCVLAWLLLPYTHEFFSGLSHLFLMLEPGVLAAAHQVVTFFGNVIGGMS